MRILIGGDIVPTNSNIDSFCTANVYNLVGEKIANRLSSADFIIHNLEVPLVDYESPIEKCGPCLVANTESIKGLKAINPYFYTLANNHILDQGEKGLRSTINTLNKEGISYAGAGMNSEEAAKTFFITIKGYRIGIFCCCEHEFSVAGINSPGANLFDPLYSLDQIVESKSKCDYLIVLHHGGKEHYRYPSPGLQKVCRRMIDKGADLVVCQHSHCIGCKEEWKNGTIVYGQGNFLFDRAANDCWNTGLLIQLDFEVSNSNPNITYIPLKKYGEVIREAEDNDANRIIGDFITRSKEILDSLFLLQEYRKFSKVLEWDYYVAFSGKKAKNIIFRIINKLSGYKFVKYYIGKNYSRQEKIVLQNFIECEAHREIMLEALKEEENTISII